MLSFSNLIKKAKDLLRKGGLPVCNHEYKETGQYWKKIGKHKYQLMNRSTCKLCNDDRLSIIGDN